MSNNNFKNRFTISQYILDYSFFNGNLFFVTGKDEKNKSGLYCVNSDSKIESIIDKGQYNFGRIENSENFLWSTFYKSRTSKTLLLNKNFEINENPFTFLAKDKGNKIFVDYYDNDGAGHFCYYDEIEEIFLWEKDFNSAKFFNGEKHVYCIPDFAFQANHLIYCLEKLTGKMIWKHEEDIGVLFSELDTILPSKIPRIIGVYKDELILALDGFRLCSLNKNTGKIIYKWDKLEAFKPSKNSMTLLPPIQLQIVQSQNKLIGLGRSDYWEIDLESREITYWDMHSNFLKNDVSCLVGPRLQLIKDKVYFHSQQAKGGGIYSNQKISVFNKETKEIEHTYTFDLGDNNYLSSFEVSENRLSAIDLKGTLYILE